MTVPSIAFCSRKRQNTMSSPAGDDEANEVACPQEATRLKSPKQDAQAAVFLMVYHVRSGSSGRCVFDGLSCTLWQLSARSQQASVASWTWNPSYCHFSALANNHVFFHLRESCAQFQHGPAYQEDRSLIPTPICTFLLSILGPV